MMHSFDPTPFWLHWPVSSPWQVRPATSGTNNQVWYAQTDEGRHYVLRLHQNQDRRALQQEVAITSALTRMGLPFQVPNPIATTGGDLGLSVRAEGGQMLLTLWPVIPGVHPIRDNLTQAYAGGRALADLHAAMSNIIPSPEMEFTAYGDFAQYNPRVPDPAQALADLPLESAQRKALLTLWSRLEAVLPWLYQGLPQQLIHGDYGPGNLLFMGDQVSGVLDFEVCGVDIRAIDLAAPLTWWTVEAWGQEKQWPIMEAVIRGYTSRLPLHPTEREALPDLLRLRAMASIIHRLGRYLDGRDDWAAVVDRIEDGLWWEGWLVRNQTQFNEIFNRSE